MSTFTAVSQPSLERLMRSPLLRAALDASKRVQARIDRGEFDHLLGPERIPKGRTHFQNPFLLPRHTIEHPRKSNVLLASTLSATRAMASPAAAALIGKTGAMQDMPLDKQGPNGPHEGASQEGPSQDAPTETLQPVPMQVSIELLPSEASSDKQSLLQGPVESEGLIQHMVDAEKLEKQPEAQPETQPATATSNTCPIATTVAQRARAARLQLSAFTSHIQIGMDIGMEAAAAVDEPQEAGADEAKANETKSCPMAVILSAPRILLAIPRLVPYQGKPQDQKRKKLEDKKEQTGLQAKSCLSGPHKEEEKPAEKLAASSASIKDQSKRKRKSFVWLDTLDASNVMAGPRKRNRSQRFQGPDWSEVDVEMLDADQTARITLPDKLDEAEVPETDGLCIRWFPDHESPHSMHLTLMRELVGCKRHPRRKHPSSDSKSSEASHNGGGGGGGAPRKPRPVVVVHGYDDAGVVVDQDRRATRAQRQQDKAQQQAHDPHHQPTLWFGTVDKPVDGILPTANNYDTDTFDPAFDGQFDVRLVVSDTSADTLLRTIHVNSMVCLLSRMPASQREFEAVRSHLRLSCDLQSRL